MVKSQACKLLILLFSLLPLCLERTIAATVAAEPTLSDAHSRTSKAAHKRNSLDRSGKVRKGKASYYGHEFFGKKMANGKPMNPRSNVAASKILPLGTKAKVTNVETGKSAVVDIEDRGPYVKGRIVDVSPKTAEKLDIKKEGVAPVEVKPLVVPSAEGSAKPEEKESMEKGSVKPDATHSGQ